VLSMTDQVKKLVIAKASHAEIVRAAVADGMLPLRADAWSKIAAGVTTVSEVMRSVYII
jgi:type II secretory ATPase GspE/PulE/Tfp pilus assembly ATPase PilB-like protein